VRAYFQTYGLPTLTTNCSNNLGRRQFPEKLVPLSILNALDGHPLPIFGQGLHVQDWPYVEDHCEALSLVPDRGRPGETYAVGGRQETTNLSLAPSIRSDLLEEFVPPSSRRTSRYHELIQFVADRPVHDQWYTIDPSTIERELGWGPRRDLAAGLRKTLLWYLDHRGWCDRITAGVYRRERLGLLSHQTNNPHSEEP
jgi:dTDP-glucose 4,6-dehydratase